MIKCYLNWDTRGSLDLLPGWGTSWPRPWHEPYEDRPLGWVPSPQWTHAAPWPGEHIWLRHPFSILLPDEPRKVDNDEMNEAYKTEATGAQWDNYLEGMQRVKLYQPYSCPSWNLCLELKSWHQSPPAVSWLCCPGVPEAFQQNSPGWNGELQN